MQLGAHTFGFVWHSDAESALVAIAQAGFKQVQLMATPRISIPGPKITTERAASAPS